MKLQNFSTFLLILGCYAAHSFAQTHPCDEPPTTCFYYRPHSDCNRVWNCRNNPPYLDYCNPDRYWNAELCICDVIANVTECIGGTRPPVTMTTTPEETPEPEPTIPPPTTPAPIHPCDVPVSTCIRYRPYPQDCNKLWNCINNPPTLTYCNADRYWNQDLCICDLIANVTECVGGTRPPMTTTTTTTSQPEPTVTTTTPTPIHPCDQPPTTCWDYRPYYEDCNRLWNCKFSPPILDRCNEDRYWDHERCICEVKENVTGCEGGTRPPLTTPVTTTTLAPGQCPPSGVAKIPHETDCGSYYLCQDGEREEHSCPQGLWFDPILQECNFPDEVDCVPVTTPNPVCPATGSHQVPNPNGDCTTYLLCVDGEQVGVVPCPEGLFFDVVDRMCKPEEFAMCEIP